MPDKDFRIISNPVIHVCSILLLCLVVYSNTFHVPFVFDDEDSIVWNFAIKDIGNYFGNSSGYLHNPTRYIGYLTFALNYEIGGLDVTGYHIFNLVIHLLNGILVYYLVLLTFSTPFLKDASPGVSPKILSFLAAIFFSIHPVQTEAVTYVVQRLTSMAAFFYLLSLCLYIKARLFFDSGKSFRWKAFSLYIVSIGNTLLAMETKEISFTLPFILMLYEFFFFRTGMRRSILFLFPFMMTLLVIPMTLVNINKPLAEILSDVSDATRLRSNVSRYEYLLTQFCVVTTYLRLLFLPFGQNLDYDYPIYPSFFTPRVVFSFLFLILAFAIAIHFFRKSRSGAYPSFRVISFGIFWFFVALSVESSVIPVVDVIFEHRLYLPSIGIILAVTMLMGFVYGSVFRGKHGMAFRLLVVIGILALSIATFQRNMIWGSALSLWEDVVKKSPGKARPYNHLGIALTSAGRNDEAYRSLVKAIELKPNYPDAYNNLGIALANKGMPDAAIEMFSRSIRLNPNFPLPYGNLGRLYLLEKGDYHRAIEMSRTALELNPYYTDAYVNLASSYNQLGQFNNAAQLLEGAYRYLERVPEAHYNLGFAYYRSGNSAGADRELAILKRMNAGLAFTLERVMVEASK